jgi:rhamnulokinase
VGTEEREPVINDQTLAYNLTNEGGVDGTFRLLRNVMGLWLLQQCRRAWEREGRAHSYEELASLAGESPSFASLVDPDDSAFLNPPDMPAAIRERCRRYGQTVPEELGAMVRCIVESLALKYRWVVESLEAVTGRAIETIHVIGGGSQNRQLCQATADASGRRVLAGPVEATSAGNVMVQAMGLGAIGTLADGRALIGRSLPVVEYLPSGAGRWHEPYERFCALLEQEGRR